MSSYVPDQSHNWILIYEGEDDNDEQAYGLKAPVVGWMSFDNSGYAAVRAVVLIRGKMFLPDEISEEERKWRLVWVSEDSGDWFVALQYGRDLFHDRYNPNHDHGDPCTCHMI